MTDFMRPMNLLPMFLAGDSGCLKGSVWQQRKRVHDITMIDNRGKSPRGCCADVPSCIDYLEQPSTSADLLVY